MSRIVVGCMFYVLICFAGFVCDFNDTVMVVRNRFTELAMKVGPGSKGLTTRYYVGFTGCVVFFKKNFSKENLYVVNWLMKIG